MVRCEMGKKTNERESHLWVCSALVPLQTRVFSGQHTCWCWIIRSTRKASPFTLGHNSQQSHLSLSLKEASLVPLSSVIFRFMFDMSCGICHLAVFMLHIVEEYYKTKQRLVALSKCSSEEEKKWKKRYLSGNGSHLLIFTLLVYLVQVFWFWKAETFLAEF